MHRMRLDASRRRVAAACRLRYNERSRHDLGSHREAHPPARDRPVRRAFAQRCRARSVLSPRSSPSSRPAAWSILVDDEDRENEGDPGRRGRVRHAREAVNFMAQVRPRAGLHADHRGSRAAAQSRADDAGATARCTAPISPCRSRPPRRDHRHFGRGSRAHDPRRRVARTRRPTTSCSPATCFRWSRSAGGVLARAGHTEAVLRSRARSPGSSPAAVLCEIMKDDGTMARLPDLIEFARAAWPQDRRDHRPDPLPQPDRAPDRARRRAPDHDRRGRLSGSSPYRDKLDRRDAPGAGARRHRAGAAKRSCACTRRSVDLLDYGEPRAFVDDSGGARERSRAPGRGVLVLLHRAGVGAGAARPRALADQPPRREQDGPAQLTASARRSCAT